MAVKQNSSISKQNLILNIDTSDYINCFKGAPKTNLLSYFSRTYGETNNVDFKTHYYSRQVEIPTLGLKTVESIDTFNTGANVCCQQAWALGSSAVSPSTQYTYSIIYRSATDYTHPNFMYHYQYGPSGYVTEYGLFNTGYRTYLGDGWYHAWNTFTSNSATTSMNFYFYMYEYNQYNTIDVYGMMVTQGPEVLRPQQFIPFSTTRGVNDVIVDLTKNSSVVTANNSPFNETGMLEFDGTNSHITLTNPQTYASNQRSFEMVVKVIGVNASYMPIATMTNTSSITNSERFWLGIENSRAQFHGWGSSDPQGTKVITDGNWHHIVFTYDNDTKEMRVYTDGCLNTRILNGEGGVYASSGQKWYIGYDPLASSWTGAASNNFNGNIAVFKQYNKILTPEETFNNFNQYKTKYSIPYSVDTTLGGSSDTPAPSARLLSDMGYTTNGNYWLKPTNVATPFLAYIDFTSDGGPWVHVGTIADENETSNNSTYHKWSNDMNAIQSCPPWDDTTTFGGSSPTFTSDYKNDGWNYIPFKQIMIKDAGNTQRKILHTNESEIKSSNGSLREWFSSLKWGALGSDASNEAHSRNRVKSVAITNYGISDPVLQSSGKSRLLFKYGEIDGTQDGNKDRTMIAWHKHDAANGVDGPSGLGCFTNRGGTIDYRDIIPGSIYADGQDFPPANISGTYYYSIWIK